MGGGWYAKGCAMGGMRCAMGSAIGGASCAMGGVRPARIVYDPRHLAFRFKRPMSIQPSIFASRMRSSGYFFVYLLEIEAKGSFQLKIASALFIFVTKAGLVKRLVGAPPGVLSMPRRLMIFETENPGS
ncbi:hypothetical protein EK21DRAFT_94850 [Setomelanomma holmii]|uniref:Uncharacterized protein n=1 Tax=Setomelanomma holmii TaxID=210430 RepID=A0A9P4GX30_9PLEO|nr:hypothetical protein EK21DRAFT_94850 [Setomelanomma holmii]